jgi:hypothetical protein
VLKPVLDQAKKKINKIAGDYESAGKAKYERGSLLRI